MRSRLQCLIDNGTAEAGSGEAVREDPPCQITVNAVLDILEVILKERSKGGEAPLRLDDVQEVIAQVKQAPGHLQKLYE